MQTPTFLGIEAATQVSSVALFHENQLIEIQNTQQKSHNEKIMGMIHSLLARFDLQPTDIQALAVGIGPGSFTGIRLAVGLAQALGYGLQIPIWPVSSLQALALATIENTDCSDLTVLSTWDARMGGVYWGLYTPDTKLGIKTLRQDSLSRPDEISLHCYDIKRLISVGNGIEAYADKLKPILAPVNHQHLTGRAPNAAHLIKLAQKMRANQVCPTPAERLLPAYVRDQVTQGA